MSSGNVTRAGIRQAIRELELSEAPLCVHSSLRSFGTVEGGARAILDACLAEGCTVMVPAFTGQLQIAPPPDMRPPRNGWDYAVEREMPGIAHDPYTPESNVIDPDMGAIPAALLATPGRLRGNHALDSFAALGPLANELIQDQSPNDVYAPLRALAEADGYVVLMGVGLSRMTALHLAEQMSGRTLFRRWALDPAGNPMMAEIGTCSEGFPRLDGVLAPLERRVVVGASLWRVFPMQPALDAASEAMRINPEITRCDDPRCLRCEDSIAGGPIVSESLR